MEDYNNSSSIIIHPSEIYGEVCISGAKNATLKHQAASILSDNYIILDNYPSNMSDVKVHEQMLIALGKKIERNGKSVIISGKIESTNLIWDGRSIRNTLLILGCLLTKTGQGQVPLPGGCKLGERKYDIHVSLMEAFGAEVWDEGDYLKAKIKTSNRLKACNYTLPIRSTGATENAILMACLADGTSQIWNPHIRPEILDLITLLNKMGAKIIVRGQESIIIEGVISLKNNVQHTIISDNMQALTYLIAGGLCAKELLISNFPHSDLEIPLHFLKFSGLKYYGNKDEIIVKKCSPYPVDISTGPYPGINSDMQPLFAAWGANSKGTSTITDLRFVGRYGYAEEMQKMGIKYEIQDNRLLILGSSKITGATVNAIDLRAGAALLLLSLIASTPTEIKNFWMIERGYDNISKILSQIGIEYSINKFRK